MKQPLADDPSPLRQRTALFLTSLRPLLLLWCCRRIGCWGRRISRGFLSFALGFSLSLRFRFLLWSCRFGGRRLIALLSARVRRWEHARRRRYSCSHVPRRRPRDHPPVAPWRTGPDAGRSQLSPARVFKLWSSPALPYILLCPRNSRPLTRVGIVLRGSPIQALILRHL
jgi:hypothetical protein